MVLGATLGMCLMVAANHALIILLGIEMASVPSYVLGGRPAAPRAQQRSGLEIRGLRRGRPPA